MGSVAEIFGLPADALHRYRVRFADGAEASLRRKDFSLLGHYKTDEAGLPHPLSEQDLGPYIIYRCVVIHLLRTGEVEANLVALNDVFRLSYLPDLIDRKLQGAEKGVLPAADLALHESEFQRLVAVLEEAAVASHLPEAPSAQPALHDLLVRVRLRGLAPPGGA